MSDLESATKIPELPKHKNELKRKIRDRYFFGYEATQVIEDEKLLNAILRKAPRKSEPFPRVDKLEARLKKVIEGEVRFDRGSRALYATDASNYRQVPIGVVIPKTKQDIIKTVELAREFNAPILSRGGGTSLAGQGCNVAIIMDTSKYYNKILSIDVDKKTVRIQPGIVLDRLKDEVEKHGLTFGPDPATHSRCTLGGMMGNNSCGMHAQWAGRTEHNVQSLEVLTYGGTLLEVGETSEEKFSQIQLRGGMEAQIYRELKVLKDKYSEKIREKFPEIPRKVSGYNLDQLLPERKFNVARALIGSESTCVTILEATLQLLPMPKEKVVAVLGYPSVFEAADEVMTILPFKPIAFEGLDNILVEHARRKQMAEEFIPLLPDGTSWLMVEFGGDTLAVAMAQAQAMVKALKASSHLMGHKIITDKDEQEKFWDVRDSGLGATASVPGEDDTWEGWEDSAVPPEKMGQYLRLLHKLYEKYGYRGAMYGHFGQGCLHTRINWDLSTHLGVEKYRQFIHEAARLIARFGGSLSGEHGDGQSRGELLPLMFGPELVEAFKEFKSIWDPQWKMNPGKIVEPFRATQNLRIGPEYNPPQWQTKFKFPKDKGSFTRATIRCVGVGACRQEKGGVMCPSYMVTKEELHSTRGRARMLFEMLEGNPLKQKWKEEKVKEALDLCLSCKGCKTDCPVNVDMASYKAEFLSHYYKGRLRPRTAYAMGLIYWWAGIASLLPRLANWISHSPWTGPVFKWLGGLASEREVPSFARETFRNWYKSRGSIVASSLPTSGTFSTQSGNKFHADGSVKKVILWIDTFNNHFHPQIGQAAVQVLESAGYQVEIPKARLCCGRPLYDYGMLNLAEKLLKNILHSLQSDILAGVPVVGLEPSCTAVFRDELLNLFPNDLAANRLSKQTFLLSEFVAERRSEFNFKNLNRKAIVHSHCHQHADFGIKPDLEVLEAVGVDAKVIDSGCCGMAGSFGFEKDHYEISQQIGERILIPAVKSLPEQTLVLTNGFSCHEQIWQSASRKSHHIAEILRDSINKN